MTKEGGQFDMTFGEKSLTFNYPNRTQSTYDVTSIEGDKMVLEKGDQKINVVQKALTQLKHTVSTGFTFEQDGEDLVMWRYSARNQT